MGLVERNELCQVAMRPAACAMSFTDIVGFASLCEGGAAPQLLSRAVRVYFERVTRLTLFHGGVVDKYVGDCVMAVWGASQTVSHAEIRAALCALAVQRATLTAPLATVFAGMTSAPLRVAIGVASGEVLAGNVGSAERMSYTVIGDAVNLASRLGGLNREWGTSTLLSDDVALEAAPLVVTRMVVRAAVIGRTAPVDVYDVAGLRPDACDAAARLVAAGGGGSSVSGGDSDGDDDDDRVLAAAPPPQHAAAPMSADGVVGNPTTSTAQGAGTVAAPSADAAAAQGVRRVSFLHLVRWHARGLLRRLSFCRTQSNVGACLNRQSSTRCPQQSDCWKSHTPRWQRETTASTWIFAMARRCVRKIKCSRGPCPTAH
jgi:class 3 adenylate cyclase